ncbi:hypothetical protein ACFQI7_31745 [Paenibacillus allorhizosphaerae]|uniref:Uncharacterized protein n=1 Tax=Paenibacillus allorhizosphaerae TaxID=2849866 RepID=A0ABM8VPY5_9BACL|nr:hypothetical protein [Paenibacillus allorhizosphaerae]CAG7653444.1 hypothetical protein PAECIP111802_05484 [Paenibacillus allorhizosphaerae]
MNSQFLLWVLLLMLYLLFLDLKAIPKLGKSMKRMYFSLLFLTGLLYISIIFGIKPPMPTQYFINNVSTWVFSLIHAK